MALSQGLVTRSLARSVKAGTALQDALEKIKRARRINETAFDIAIGECWVLCMEVFNERNQLKGEKKQLLNKLKLQADEIKYLREKVGE